MVPLLPLVHTFVAYWSLLLDVLRVTMLLIGDPIGFRLLSSDCDPLRVYQAQVLPHCGAYLHSLVISYKRPTRHRSLHWLAQSSKSF
jgi:hypothetical protein